MLDLQLPFGVALRGFLVQQGGIFGGATLAGNDQNANIPGIAILVNNQFRPGLDFFAGLARCPLTWTFPPLMASVARLRVL